MSALYDPGREGILDETIGMSSGDIRAMLLLSTYVFSAAHKFLADLGAVDNGRTLTALIGRSFTSGVFDAADDALTATAALASNAYALFKHTGSDATARVVAYIGTAEFTPAAGQGVLITWNNGANKIFKL